MFMFMSRRVALSTLVVSGPLTPRGLAAEASLSLSRARNLCSELTREGLAHRRAGLSEGREIFTYSAAVDMLPSDVADIEQLVACYGLDSVVGAAGLDMKTTGASPMNPERLAELREVLRQRMPTVVSGYVAQLLADRDHWRKAAQVRARLDLGHGAGRQDPAALDDMPPRESP